MTIEPELLMAYADDALDPLTAKRVERAVAADPPWPKRFARHRRLKAKLGAAYAPIMDDPVPDPAGGDVDQQCRADAPAPAPPLPRLFRLAFGGGDGGMPRRRRSGRSRRSSGGYRSRRPPWPLCCGSLAEALDDQASGTGGPVRIAVSFRAQDNGFCRVFQSAEADGMPVAIRRAGLAPDHAGSTPGAGTGYVRAGSSDAELMAAAQNMMADMPLDAAGEKKAIASHWRAR